MINLYVDFDGVILDTIEMSSRMMEEEKIDSKDIEKVINFYKHLDWEYLLKITPEINNSLSCLQRVIDTNLFYVSILTHVNSLDEVVHKLTYIRRYFKDIDVIPVPKAVSKTKMVRTEGSVLIDDYSGNLREWKNKNGIPIRFSKELESKGFLVINRLDQVVDLFREEKVNSNYKRLVKRINKFPY